MLAVCEVSASDPCCNVVADCDDSDADTYDRCAEGACEHVHSGCTDKCFPGGQPLNDALLFIEDDALWIASCPGEDPPPAPPPVAPCWWLPAFCEDGIHDNMCCGEDPAGGCENPAECGNTVCCLHDSDCDDGNVDTLDSMRSFRDLLCRVVLGRRPQSVRPGRGLQQHTARGRLRDPR